MAQEALANVAQHARANRVGVTLSYLGDEVTLDVRDDGVGFEPTVAGCVRRDGNGFGVAGMRERVERLAGIFAVESGPEPAPPSPSRYRPWARAMADAPDRIRVLIVDDHPVVRDGLRGMLAGQADYEVVGEAANGKEAVARARTFAPDVVLMDLRMPELDGVAVIKRLAQLDVAARVLVLTTYDTDSDVLPAIAAGATGYLLKDTPREDLFRAVRAAARGESVVSPSVATRLLDQMRQPAAEPLTAREREILQLVADGCTNADTARRLFVSEATVKTHLAHAYAKLGVSDRAAAVAVAMRRGLLPTHEE